MTVFLVDDEAAVRKAVARLLRAEGFEVLTFGSSEEFLAAHDPAVPGCLLLDMSMPGLDGLGLQESLADGGSSRPVIFLSGPEGGLSAAEEQAARSQGFMPVSLGPRTLRAETAPLAALAALTLGA